jgi:hypothetical protein
MRIQIQLRIIADDNSVISEGEIPHFDKGDDRLEVIGLSFNDAKAALAGIQGRVVTAQALPRSRQQPQQVSDYSSRETIHCYIWWGGKPKAPTSRLPYRFF